jgi:hypothetical protein
MKNDHLSRQARDKSKENCTTMCDGQIIDKRFNANPTGGRRKGEKTCLFLRHLYIKCIILPRQARDKHRESTQKREAFSCRPRVGRLSIY